ncbi:MAG: carboxypeptidase regulatory-like domain-containing protein, partial [Verrucomicrobiales bacterium]|nr:carboxypeptidase regulatory-like domain-containing protein [Verrucomicrobiales bacterium]
MIRRLREPLVVRLTGADGSPVSGAVLVFEVIRSNGRLLAVDDSTLAADWRQEPSADDAGAMRLSVRTDTNGEARAWWRLGSDAGCANNRVSVTGSVVGVPAYFCASALPDPARQLNIGSGNEQRVEAGALSHEPLRVWASDGLNPSVGVPITFRVLEGQGRLVAGGHDGTFRVPATRAGPDDDVQELVVVTGATGHASVGLVTGPRGGPNVVEASFPGQFGLPATFTVHGLARDPNRTGTLAGVVLDNTTCPIGGAVCVLTTADHRQETTTDRDGKFRFDGVPGGMGRLQVDGRAATHLLGTAIPTNSFPALGYAVVTVPNAENSLPGPVQLPRLNPANAIVYHGTNDLVVTSSGVDGLRFTIRANSMTDPSGNRVSPANPVVVSLDPVHADKVPTPMPDGASPPFAWTLQPGGARFDEDRPVELEYPNMSGLPPGSVAYFLTFDPGTERYEIVSSGTVSSDGSTIASDAGSGITVAGWGGNCPPYSVSADVSKCPTCEPDCGGVARHAVRPESQCFPDCPPGERRDPVTKACRSWLCGPAGPKLIDCIPGAMPGFGSCVDSKVLGWQNKDFFAEALNAPEWAHLPAKERVLKADLVRNARLHLEWQCFVTCRYGVDAARTIAMQHEVEQFQAKNPGSYANVHYEVDMLVDLFHNELGRELAARATSCTDCGDLARMAIENGEAITDIEFDPTNPFDPASHRLSASDMARLAVLPDPCPASSAPEARSDRAMHDVGAVVPDELVVTLPGTNFQVGDRVPFEVHRREPSGESIRVLPADLTVDGRGWEGPR